MFVLLFNHSNKDFQVKKGECIVQLILERNATPEIKEDTELNDTIRGNQGFGSTGKTITPETNTDKQEKDILIAKIGKTKEGDEIWIATTKELLAKDEVWINTKTSSSIEFHLLHDKKEDTFLLMEQIPEEYHKFIDVFDEKKAN